MPTGGVIVARPTPAWTVPAKSQPPPWSPSGGREPTLTETTRLAPQHIVYSIKFAAPPSHARAASEPGAHMLALRKLSAEPGPPALAEVQMPLPAAGEVRIAVTAAGLCGTDFHTLNGEYPSRPPVTLGHEVAGRVDAV